MDDADAPLLAAWRRFVDADVAPFTVPGHKRRAGDIWPTLGRLLDGDVPMFGGLDSIKGAVHALAAAERRGAELWGADWCRYSTGGSTHVNQVAALAVGRPGATVLVARTAHRSTLSGLILAGLDPVWLPTDVDTEFGLPCGLSMPALHAALAEHPDAAAVFCVEPSFVGTLSDLPAVVEAAHARDVPVVVDQAWGGHFGFHRDYPRHAMQAGADVMITSAHKTLPAYSQAAVIAANTRLLDADRLDRCFDASFTTSPAGSILASIDASRAVLAAPLGADLLERQARLVGAARQRLRSAGLRLPGPEDYPPGRFDPAKLVVLFDRNDGNAVERALVAAGMPVEQADRSTVIAMATMLDDESTLDRLCTVIETATAESPSASTSALTSAVTSAVTSAADTSVWTPSVPPVAMSPREAFFAEHEIVPAEQAVGRISAELIAPYPPGIPVLAPGELITAATLEALESAARSGVRIAYAQDPTLRTYVVIE